VATGHDDRRFADSDESSSRPEDAPDGGEFIEAADRELRETYEEPKSLADFVDEAFENPTVAAHASKYLLEAIESMGTRTVVEEGDEKERYVFFDDPHNDGEHAILGNTEVLNAFVDDLRSIAAERGKAEKIIWFDGPTATGKLDPFSREAYDYLEEQYRRNGEADLFSAITDPNHLRVKNYVVDIGTGIGVLHSEDSGPPKERLVGSWMRGMLQELDSRGRKNPQAFSYDGVLSQGNGLLTIVEDAAQHADLLQKLLNVPDEKTVKLDKGIQMDIDTQLLIISNPDLEAQLNQHAEAGGADPLKALKRRLDRRRFKYLTNLSLEAELIRRELTNETDVWEAESYDELENLIREPLGVQVRNDESGAGVGERELAPHAVEAAALYSVVTRLDGEDVPAGLDLVDKAKLFDRGYLLDGDDRLDADDFDFDDDADDGEQGIPVTYTRDVIADLLNDESERAHADYPVEEVIMPRDILNAMAEGLTGAPVFSTAERTEYENRLVPVKNHIFQKQEEDVLDAIMADKRVDEETVEEYIEHVYAWATDEQVENDRGERVAPDPLKMKVFETEHLGRFSPESYDGDHSPTPAVEEFRRNKVITALNRHAWENRDEGFEAADIDPKEIPIIKTVLANYDWDDVRRVYEDFDPNQWADPPSNTETAAVKTETIENLVAMFGYSEASAELTSQHVMSQVSYKWD